MPAVTGRIYIHCGFQLHARQLEKFSKLARDAKYPQKVVTEEQAF
jgi:hypothetical protein